MKQAGMAPTCTECTDLDLAADCMECIKEGIGRTILMNSLSICTANTSTRKWLMWEQARGVLELSDPEYNMDEGLTSDHGEGLRNDLAIRWFLSFDKVQLLNIMEMNDGTHSVIILLLLKETSKHYIIFIK